MPAKYEVAADADGGEDNPPCPDWASGVLRCRDGAGAPGECAVEQSVSLAEAVAGCRDVRCLAGKSRWLITAGFEGTAAGRQGGEGFSLLADSEASVCQVLCRSARTPFHLPLCKTYHL